MDDDVLLLYDELIVFDINGEERMKSYYADYVNHMMRIYFRTHEPENINWKCVHSVLEEESPETKELLKKLYSSGKVEERIKEINIDPTYAYKKIAIISRKIARERGLL